MPKRSPPKKAKEPVSLALVPLSMIEVDLAANPRGTDWLESEEFEALKDNIIETQKRGFPSGLLTSVTVKPINEKGKAPYRLVAGYRRCVALQQLFALTDDRGLKRHPWAEKIPCILQSPDAEPGLSTLDALVENLQRQNMPLFEEAKALQAVLKAKKCTRQVLAKMVGRSPAYITQRMQLLKFAPEVQARAAEMGLGIAPLRDIGRLPNAEEQLKLLDEIKLDKVSTDDLRDRVTEQVGKSKRGRPAKEPDPPPTTEPDQEPSDDADDSAAPPEPEISGGTLVPPKDDPAPEAPSDDDSDDAQDPPPPADEPGPVDDDDDDDDDDDEPEEKFVAPNATDEADLQYLRHIAKTTAKHSVRLVAVAILEWEKRRQGKPSSFSDMYSADSLHDSLADKMDFEF